MFEDDEWAKLWEEVRRSKGRPGRKPLGERAMTAAERQRRRREHLRATDPWQAADVAVGRLLTAVGCQRRSDLTIEIMRLQLQLRQFAPPGGAISTRPYGLPCAIRVGDASSEAGNGRRTVFARPAGIRAPSTAADAG